MYQAARYTEVNNIGTAVLLEALSQNPVERLIVASSMSIYGEGRYVTADGEPALPVERTLAQMKRGDWEVYDTEGHPLTPIATDENKIPALASVYALSKYDQERLCLVMGKAYNFPTVALRFFNAYGTRQALSNPYTGVLAIFASRYLNGRPPLITEDGNQKRDFVSVRDIARACRLALTAPDAPGNVFNVGSGRAMSVSAIADEMARALNCEHITPEITGKYRVGDIRHCFSDIQLAREVLGYEPQVTLDEGLAELCAWLEGQNAVDHAEDAQRELSARGLAV
jgi:dTDP-L-rhamnose 4-epimerase